MNEPLPEPPPEAVADTAVPQKQMPGKRRLRRRLLVALAVGCIIMAAMLPRVLWLAREKARRANCAGNLKCLGLSLLMYSGDYDGYFPVGPDLTILVDMNYVQNGRIWSCPSSAIVTTTPATSSYIYIGSGLMDEHPQASRTPLMYDGPANHENWINVLFIDGHVERFQAVDWPSLAAAQGWQGAALDQ